MGVGKLIVVAGGLRGLPVTRQTTSYRDGDDGFFQAGWKMGTTPVSNQLLGSTAAAARFTVNGDGTITDNTTGLMWIANVAAIGAPWNAAQTWNNAVDNCLGLTYATYTDWRLPNIIEAVSIVDLSGVDATFVYAGFTLPAANCKVWSSTSHSTTTYARYAGFASVFGGPALKTDAATFYAIPCRGGLFNNNVPS